MELVAPLGSLSRFLHVLLPSLSSRYTFLHTSEFSLQDARDLSYHLTAIVSLEKVMNISQPSKESMDRFFKANEELMRMGEIFRGNIDVALDGFRTRMEAFLKTHFMEKAVAEMLAQTFSEFERETRTNLDGINKICTEGGQWYAFCFGSALGHQVSPPGSAEVPDMKAKRTALPQLKEIQCRTRN